MIYIACQSNRDPIFWGKGPLNDITDKLKQKRLSYILKDNLEDLPINNKSTNSDTAILIGESEDWVSKHIDICAEKNISVIIMENISKEKLKGNYNILKSDWNNSADMLINYFHKYGKNRIAVYGAKETSTYDTALVNSFKGQLLYECPVFWNADSVKECYELFYKNRNEYDALLCTNDYMAIDLIKRLQQHDPTYLNDVFIVSCSNTILSKLFSPTITTLYGDDIADTIIKMYQMLNKLPSINNIHINYIQALSIRETTHFCPQYEESDLENNSKSFCSHSEKSDYPVYPVGNEDTILEMYKLESLFSELDKTDIEIIYLLLNKISLREIEKTLFISRGSLRYRLKKMETSMNLQTQEELVKILEKYIDADNLQFFYNTLNASAVN